MTTTEVPSQGQADGESCPGLIGLCAAAECHKAKNLVPESGGKPTKVGEKVLQLQRMLPLARVVYCSATGETLISFSQRAFTSKTPRYGLHIYLFTDRLSAYHPMGLLQSIQDLSVEGSPGLRPSAAPAQAPASRATWATWSA